MVKIILALALAGATSEVPPSERLAFKKARDFRTESANVRMTVEKGGGKKTLKEFRRYSQIDPQGKMRVVVEVISPASSAGDRLLFVEGEGAWRYIQQNGRRERPIDFARAFLLGSTVRNEIVLPHPLSDFTYAEQEDGMVARTPTYTSSYEKIVVRIDTNGNLIHVDYYAKGRLEGVFDITGYHDVAGHSRPARMVHGDAITGNKTTLEFSDWKFDFPADPSNFKQEGFTSCCPP